MSITVSELAPDWMNWPRIYGAPKSSCYDVSYFRQGQRRTIRRIKIAAPATHVVPVVDDVCRLALVLRDVHAVP